MAMFFHTEEPEPDYEDIHDSDLDEFPPKLDHRSDLKNNGQPLRDSPDYKFENDSAYDRAVIHITEVDIGSTVQVADPPYKLRRFLKSGFPESTSSTIAMAALRKKTNRSVPNLLRERPRKSSTGIDGYSQEHVTRSNGHIRTHGISPFVQVDDGKESSAPKEPLLIAKLIARKPYLTFGITFGMHLVMILVTVILYFSGYDIFPINFNSIPINLAKEQVYLRQEAFKHRDTDHILYNRATGGGNVTERSMRYDKLTMQFVYEDIGGNVFTLEHLQAIKDFEDDLFNDATYQSAYCQLGEGRVCDKPHSIIRFFDGTYARLDPVFNDTQFQNIAQVLWMAEKITMTRRVLQFFLGKDSTIRNNSASSEITRSLFFYGYPLKGFDSPRDESEEQYNVVGDYMTSRYADKWLQISKEGIGGMSFMYMNQIIYWHLINSQVVYDMLFVIFSFVFIFAFMWFQTGSIWLSVWGMFNIIFSIISGNFIYNVILDFKYVGILHVLVLFILLGIGADDVFIFCDAWKLAKDHDVSLAYKLSDCYRRAAGTMFVTSFTTAAAFFTNSFSPILAMSSFGTFAGVCVLVNYLSIITFYPTTVVIWHIKWESKQMCGGSQKNESSQERRSCNTRAQRAIVGCLSGRYYRVLMNTVVRVTIFILFTALLGTFIYFATTLEPDDKTPRVMKASHNIEKFQDKTLHAFRPSGEDDVVKLNIVWGLKSQDKSSCHPRKFDDDCVGRTVWDNCFDLNPPRAQKAMLEFCNKLRTLPEDVSSRLGVRRDLVTHSPEIKCFIEKLDSFFESETNGTSYEMSLPTTETKMRSFMASQSHLYNMSEVTEIFYRYFETAYGFWISNKYNGQLSSDNEAYQAYLGESFDPDDTHDIIGRAGVKYGTRLRYAVIAANLSFGIAGIYFQDGLNYYNEWENLLEKELSKMPPSVQGAFHTTNFAWQWFHIQQVLVRQGIISVVAGVSVAWLILVLSSGNVIVGTMATVTIAAITVCVVGVIPLAGWKLGVLEAMNMTLVVGLSVDYAVHLGVSYTHAPYTDRKRRVRHALSEIGLSVISGAITTLGSGFFMMFAEIIFFMQFGIFIFATIGFSIVFAITFFLVALSFIGPEGNTGATGPLVKYVKYKLIGRKSDDVSCEQCKGRGFHRHKPESDSLEITRESTTWF